MTKIIAIDLGGTNTRATLVEDAKIKKIVKEKTLSKGSKKQVLNQIISIIKKLPLKNVEGVALGLPSKIDDKSKKIIYTTNIPKLKNFNIISELKKEFQVPIKIANDADCFLLGEKNYGFAKNHSSVIGLILGTGLGLAIIKNNKLVSESKFFKKEIGYYKYLDKNYEDYCSGKFFEKKGFSGEELYKRALKKDKNAIEIFEEFEYHLSKVIEKIISRTKPNIIVIGGSISKAYKFFKITTINSKIKIVASKNENIALLGAYSLFKD